MSFKWYMGSLDIGNVFKVWKYNKEFRKQHPEYFDPDGIIVFCGMQGAGKTISAVQYVQKLCELYPQVKVCSNMICASRMALKYIPGTVSIASRILIMAMLV